MLKIKQGSLYIPGSIVINEGLATAMRDCLQSLERINVQDLSRVIFDRNALSDGVFCKVLQGLWSRREFKALTSVGNDIGAESAEYIAKMLRPKKPTVQESTLEELILISNKITTVGMDIILHSLAISVRLRHLTLQNICCANSQYMELFKIIKQNQALVGLDISWNKLATNVIQRHLFPALEKNKTLEYLNLSHIKMSSALLSKTFCKFTTFVKENDRLMHLNLSAIELLPDLMLELIVNIKRSISLHCVHICGNRLDKAAKYLLLTKLKPYLHQQKIQETLAS